MKRTKMRDIFTAEDQKHFEKTKTLDLDESGHSAGKFKQGLDAVGVVSAFEMYQTISQLDG